MFLIQIYCPKIGTYRGHNSIDSIVLFHKINVGPIFFGYIYCTTPYNFINFRITFKEFVRFDMDWPEMIRCSLGGIFFYIFCNHKNILCFFFDNYFELFWGLDLSRIDLCTSNLHRFLPDFRVHVNYKKTVILKMMYQSDTW